MKKQYIFLIISIVLALVSVFLIKSFLDSQRNMILQDAKKRLSRMQEEVRSNQSPVLVAKKDIAPREIIQPEYIEIGIISNQSLHPQAVTSLDRAVGMMAVVPIARGEQIISSKLTYSREEGRGLAESTPIGKRAITISVSNLAALVGLLKAGDYVDVIALGVPLAAKSREEKKKNEDIIIPLFQNVLVLSVGQDTGAGRKLASAAGRKEEEKKDQSSITLALAPHEANLLSFVQEHARINLILRSPSDSQIQETTPITWDSFFKEVIPQEEPQEQQLKSKGTVEIYRGLNREQAVLY